MNSSSEHGNSSRAALPQLFFSGRTDEVLKLTVDQAFGDAIAMEHWPFVIGSLCFKGRIDEADIRFQSLRSQLSDEELVACRFYLGIGFARLSQYGKARTLFTENLILLRRHPNDHRAARISFYVWQGIGFFRQLCGRKILAMRAAQKAWQAAIAADFYFGRMLSTELLGHSLIGCGRIAVGLRELEAAYGLAQNLGHGASPARSGSAHARQVVSLAKENSPSNDWSRGPAMGAHSKPITKGIGNQNDGKNV